VIGESGVNSIWIKEWNMTEAELRAENDALREELDELKSMIDTTPKIIIKQREKDGWWSGSKGDFIFMLEDTPSTYFKVITKVPQRFALILIRDHELYEEDGDEESATEF
jgi:hypothetical protein